MSADAAQFSRELNADRIRLSELANALNRQQDQFRILTEDPANLDPTALQTLSNSVNSTRQQIVEVRSRVESLQSFINILPAGAERTQRQTESQAIIATANSLINGVATPLIQAVPAQIALAEQQQPPPAVRNQPTPVLPDLIVQQNPEGDWAVFDLATGLPVITGLATRELAEAERDRILREALGFAGGGVTVTPVTDVRNVTAQNDEANAEQATLEAARAQAALNERRQQANQGDWRVKLRLAPVADYLYKAADPGILEPLTVTDGVIFPYTPKIDLSYRAMYDVASLTHANYNSYFYKNSLLDPVNITATFTAQDTAEANYLLAVIHFFRSVTKMFYGQDAQRGAPPPLVFFTGLGEYQFAEHPCLVHQFNYSLPSDVDYIRARSIMDPGTDLQNRRARSSVATTPLSYTLKRLASLGQGIGLGALDRPPPPPTLGRNSPTYVPTRIDISLILYPVQSRSQVSQQFSLQQYANGDLLRGGFW
jgi:cell division septum initiation protein DivIVA